MRTVGESLFIVAVQPHDVRKPHVKAARYAVCFFLIA